jgi:hypothetical protein
MFIYLISTFILSLLLTGVESTDVDRNAYCGMTVPANVTECTNFSNEYYTCCYAELNSTITSYSPKACYGIVNAANVTLPMTINQFTVNIYDCGLPKSKTIQDSMLCGNNVTSTSAKGCYTSSLNNTNCCEFTYDNFAVCVDTTKLGYSYSKMIDSIVCGAGNIRITFIMFLIYILLV